MQILGYKKLKDNRYKVYFKNREEIILYDEVILQFNMLTNKQLTEKQLEEIQEYNNELNSYYKALKYLAIKMRTKKGIRDYLKKNDFAEKTIVKTITRLEKEGYINEKKYIHYYVLDQINLTLKGPEKIKKTLLQELLDEELINKELNNIDKKIWQEKCQKIINKKLKVNKDSKSIFLNKIQMYLFKEGYSKDIYDDFIKNIELNDNDNFLKTANQIYQKLQKKYTDEKLLYYFKSKLYSKGYTIEQINEFINNI